MLLVAVLGMAVSSVGMEELVPVSMDRLTVGVPGAWRRSQEEGATKYTAPSMEAFFLFHVSHVQTAGMDEAVCRGKILEKMGPESAWTLLTVGGAPAARRLDADTAGDAKKTEIQTYTYVGCDGATTWSLVFHLDSRKKTRFARLAERIAQSISYSPANGP